MKVKYVPVVNTMSAKEFKDLMEDHLIRGAFHDEDMPYYDSRLSEVLCYFKEKEWKFSVALKEIIESRGLRPKDYGNKTFPGCYDEGWLVMLIDLDDRIKESDLLFFH